MNKEWEEVKLGDVIEFNPREIIKKGTISKKIGMERLNPFQRRIEGFEVTEYKSGTKFRNGDTLLARITPCLENGKTAQVTILDKDEIGFGSTEFIVLREKPKYTVNDFIYYLAISPMIREITIKSMTGTSGRQRAQKDVIENTTLKIPLIEEQKAIAHILSTLDNKIEVNNQINKKLEEIAQAIFKHWFVDFEFPNEDGEPYKSSGGEMVESELGMIPKGWEVRKLCDLVKIYTKSIKPYEHPNELFEHYSIPSLDSMDFPEFENGKNIKSNKYQVVEDSILISKLNPSKKRICNPLNITKKAICSTEFLNFLPKIKNIKNFCYALIDSDRFNDFLVQHATGSTNSRQRVKPNDTLELRLCLPIDKSLLVSFNSTVTPFYESIRKNKIQVQILRRIRDTLLPKLMSGKIRVPVGG